MANYVSQVIEDEGCDEKRPRNGVLVPMWNKDDISISLVDKKALIKGEEGGGRRRVREFDEEDEGGHWAYESLFPSLSPPHKISPLCASVSTFLSFPFLLQLPFQSFLLANSLAVI